LLGRHHPEPCSGSRLAGIGPYSFVRPNRRIGQFALGRSDGHT